MARPPYHVARVEAAGDYRLRLTFEDGLAGEINLESELWGTVFEPLRDLSVFRQVHVDPESGTVVWPNGADLAPDTLHQWVSQGRTRAPGIAS
jgi:hypothetical protein